MRGWFSLSAYDLIVVGAGSAGCAVVSRATENPALKVLLIEAGPDYADPTTTPWDLVNSHNNSYRDHDWGLNYQPTRDREVFFPRGRVTGGSSAVNTTIALRGMPEDYDGWASLGNPAWSWDAVLQAFNRLERDLDFGDAAYHGDAGPISIRRYPADEMLPQHQAFLQAAANLGYPACADANDPQGWGAGPQPMNKLGRLRVSCAVGYLAPARIRPNLTIQPEVTVTRLIIAGGRCTGVEIEDNEGARNVVQATTVVLCAGALLSPGIMMRSGLGPAGTLDSLGLEAVHAIPGVGANLCDHPGMAVNCSVHDPELIDFDSPIIQTILRYTAPGSDQRNDLQIEQLSFSGRPNDPPGFAIAAVLEYQYGRGDLRLTSADPHAPPLVDNRFCEDQRDADRLAACYRDTLAFTRAQPLADMIQAVTFPRNADDLSDADLVGLCRRFAGSGFHPCGTLKMGPAADAFAVVDQFGCAHQLDNLVIADASIMPWVPRANTNLTSIMIGEMIGEWLRTRPAMYGL